jgi:hypothetical protein
MAKGGSDDSALGDVKNYVKATISEEQGGTHSGNEVEVLADDYTSKGDEELIEVKIGDDIIFVEKKFINLENEALSPVTTTSEEFTVPETTSFSGVANVKEEEEEEFTISLDDLDDILGRDDDDEDEDDEDEDDDDDDDDEDDDEDDDDEDDDAISISDLDDKPESIFNTEPRDEDGEVLKAKLSKSLEELEDIRSEMKNTFTSTDTISTTITSLKGMLDALKKDQEELKNK